MDKISLVVPCFNEQDNIEPFYNAILKVFNDIPASFELMFVDDGSSDETFVRILPPIAIMLYTGSRFLNSTFNA